MSAFNCSKVYGLRHHAAVFQSELLLIYFCSAENIRKIISVSYCLILSCCMTWQEITDDNLSGSHDICYHYTSKVVENSTPFSQQIWKVLKLFKHFTLINFVIMMCFLRNHWDFWALMANISHWFSVHFPVDVVWWQLSIFIQWFIS